MRGYIFGKAKSADLSSDKKFKEILTPCYKSRQLRWRSRQCLRAACDHDGTISLWDYYKVLGMRQPYPNGDGPKKRVKVDMPIRSFTNCLGSFDVYAVVQIRSEVNEIFQ